MVHNFHIATMVNHYGMRNRHFMKSVRIQSYSGPHFHAFGLNTGRDFLSLRIQSECGKMRTRITPNTDTSYVVRCLLAQIWKYAVYL